MNAHDEHGMVGKIIVIWLLVVALLTVVVMDAGSILFANVEASDAAQTAATTGASRYRDTRDADLACEAAREAVPTDQELQFPKGFCKVDTQKGTVTIKLRRTAGTLLAGRLSFTRDLTQVEAIETGRPSTL
jgi:uncharacterized membrane protein